MLIQTKLSKKALLPEGDHNATLNSIKYLPDERNAKKVQFEFKVEKYGDLVIKEMPCSFDDDTLLRKDVETLLGKDLSPKEASGGVELNDLINTECKIVVMHKAGAGGKLKPVVSLILPQEQPAAIQPAAQPTAPEVTQQPAAQPAPQANQPVISQTPQPAPQAAQQSQ